MQNPTPLTHELVAAHERLYPRIASLLKQVERVAGRRPGQVVPEETVKLARGLCVEAKKLLGREGRRLPIPQSDSAAPLDHQRLAVILGQALAALEAFEAEHSGRNEKLGLAVWRLDGPPLPVRRHLPPGHGGATAKTHNPEADRLRRELKRAIMARFSAGYDSGYRDAQEGKPPSPDHAEWAWDSLVEKEGGEEEARKAGLPRPRIRRNPPRHLYPLGATPTDPHARARDRWPRPAPSP